jgi:hypothetical protein
MSVHAIGVLTRAELRHVSSPGQTSHLDGVSVALEVVDGCLPPHSSVNKT